MKVPRYKIPHIGTGEAHDLDNKGGIRGNPTRVKARYGEISPIKIDE